MEPSRAMVTAAGSALPRSPKLSSGTIRSGRPVGTSPIVGASLSHSTPTSVPMISAATDGGRNRCSRPGQKMHTARVMSPSVSALGSTLVICVGPLAQRLERAAEGYLGAEEGQHLDDDDDQADGAGEPRHHRIWRVGDEGAEPQRAEQHLDDPGHGHDGQGLGQLAVCVVDEHDRHRHRQRGGGSRDLGLGPAQQRGEHAHHDGAVQTLDGSQPRGDSEGQRQRQGHHGRGHPAEDVSSKPLELVAVLQAHLIAQNRSSVAARSFRESHADNFRPVRTGWLLLLGPCHAASRTFRTWTSVR